MLQTHKNSGLRTWLRDQLVFQKMNSPFGLGVLLLFTILFSYAIATLELKIGIVILGLIVGLPLVGACLLNAQFAVAVLLVVGIFVEFLKKHVDAPFGTALDGLLFVSLFGILIRQTQERDMSFAKNPISILVLVWVALNFLEVLNPWAESRMAWLYTVRSMAGLIIMFFIAAYAFNSYKVISSIIKLVIGLAFLSSLYGLKQEFIGYTNPELTWLYSDPKRLELIFQWGRLRIFSFFSDPTTYGVFMSYMGTFCCVLAIGPFSNARRALLLLMGGSMFASMVYAGSRTPFVLVPFGFIIFTMITLKKEILIGAMMVGILGLGFIMKGTSNPVLFRLQSAFIPKHSDDTMQVRFKNQKFIQPLIHRRPIGVGLGSTGVWAKRFTPNSFLADFAHDSGFVRIAVELGWVGLLLYMAFLFTILRTSIYYYLRVRNQKIKALYLAFTVVLFQLTLACYPQEVLVILPTSLVFYIFTAAVVRLKDFDDRMFPPQKDYSSLPTHSPAATDFGKPATVEVKRLDK